jgi:hypothetical protein
VGALGALGAAPSPTVGATLALSLFRGAWGLGIEGRADLLRRVPVAAVDGGQSDQGGTMSTALLTGTLLACARRGPLSGCGLFAAGVMRAAGYDLDHARHVAARFTGLGARLAVEIPARGPLMVRMHADAIAPLTETTLSVSGQDVWTSPPLSIALGMQIGVRFP